MDEETGNVNYADKDGIKFYENRDPRRVSIALGEAGEIYGNLEAAQGKTEGGRS